MKEKTKINDTISCANGLKELILLICPIYSKQSTDLMPSFIKRSFFSEKENLPKHSYKTMKTCLLNWNSHSEVQSGWRP